MVNFCPLCGNLLFAEEFEKGHFNLACNLCPINFNLTKPIVNRTYYKAKEIDDVLSGEEAWKNVDSTVVTCPKCAHNKAFFMQLQTRSADEPMTTFYRCCNHHCSHNWRD